jgi:hypothetical protein
MYIACALYMLHMILFQLIHELFEMAANDIIVATRRPLKGT